MASIRKATLAVAFVLGTAGQAFAQDDPRASFRAGIDLFEQGRYAEARAELEKVIAANPSEDVALEMVNEAGYQVFVELLSRKDDLATIARKVMELAERGRAKEREDAEKIQELIAKLFSDDAEESYIAEGQLASRIGPFVVPFMVEYLADRRDNDKRVKAIVLCSRLGPDGTNAVIPLLKHKDDYVRQNACAILGNIRDFKAIPYLKAVAERRDESPHVKKEAQAALKNITGKDSLEGALGYFLALAERYYQEDPRVTNYSFKDWAVWDWKDEKLAYRIVPRWLWNEEEAENACYAAIVHAAEGGDSNEAALDDIYTLLVSTLVQQYVECAALNTLAKGKSETGAIDPAEVEALEARMAQVQRALLLATSIRGEPQFFKALRKSLVDRRPELAVGLIEQIASFGITEAMLPAEGTDLAKYLEDGKTPVRAMDVAPRQVESAPEPAPEPRRQAEPAPRTIDVDEPKSDDEPAPAPEGGSRRRRVSMLEQPFGPEPVRTAQSGEAHGASLAAALTFEDKRVRYAAAIALLGLNPQKKFANSDKVVPALASAVLESGSRVIMVVAKDSQVRNRLVADVRNMNHLPVPVESGRQGIVRARSAANIDAILLHTELNQNGEATDFSTAEFIEQIEKDYRTQGTPVVVVTPHSKLEEQSQLYADKAKLVVGDNPDAVILKEQLESLWTGENARPGDPKNEAIAIAKKAAEALAKADRRSAVLDLRQAVPALMQALDMQPDAVRQPVLMALGNIRAREAVDKVAAIFDNASNPTEIRIAAAYCLGEALRGQPMPPKVYESLKAGLATPELFAAAAQALGKSMLSKEQMKSVLVDHRVE